MKTPENCPFCLIPLFLQNSKDLTCNQCNFVLWGNSIISYFIIDKYKIYYYWDKEIYIYDFNHKSLFSSKLLISQITFNEDWFRKKIKLWLTYL